MYEAETSHNLFGDDALTQAHTTEREATANRPSQQEWAYRQNPGQRLRQSTCAYCGVGCGVDVTVDPANNQPVQLTGTPEHPANFGRLCVKGTHLLDTVGTHTNTLPGTGTNTGEAQDERRLGHPFIGERQVSWQHATDYVANELSRIIAEHGKQAVSLYVSGQLLTEDYYIANKFMKGYVGTANIDTNSRLCMASAVAGYKRAFGEDVVPCDYQDLECTELLVITGSNAAWAHPVLFQRIERAKQLNPNMKVVVIDPRKTATTSIADLFLPLKPGSDVALFNGLLRYLNAANVLDDAFIDAHTEGFDAALDSARPWTLDMVADYCDLSVPDIQQFYDWFASADSAVTFYSMGVNQSSSGTDKCNAIINVHLASGKMLRKGSGPFSITGQPNAMGGREVGGLANQLAAHMDVENPQHQRMVQQFWQSPTIATEQGLKAVDLFHAIEQGDVKAVWIMATNPLVSVPNREQVLRALKKCELVIVSDCVSDAETLQLAHVKLPATGWAEKDGTVTNSERRISRQRAIMPAFAEAKHDWRIICDVAQKMGFDGFNFHHQAEIFDEFVRLTGFKNEKRSEENALSETHFSRQLDLSPLAGMSRKEYEDLPPLQWPMDKNKQAMPVFADKTFTTISGKAQFIAVTPKAPMQQTSRDFPFVLNSGRLRDHWHTMTRTGRAATLNGHIRKPQISLHPMDAHRLGIQQDDIIQAKNQAKSQAKSQATTRRDIDGNIGDVSGGMVQGYADLSEDIKPGQCFMPIHWNQQFSSHANVSNIYSSAVDPISGQPESKHGAVALSKAPYGLQWTLFCEPDLPLRNMLANFTEQYQDFWVQSKSSHCQVVYGASLEHDSQFVTKVKQLNTRIPLEWLVTQQADFQAVIGMNDGEISVAAFAWQVVQTEASSEATSKANSKAKPKRTPTIPEDWLDTIFSNKTLDLASIQSLLRLQPCDEFLLGKTVCSCFQVREKSIQEAIASGVISVQALGDTLQCGTNCGSCRSELQQMITSHMSTMQTISAKKRDVQSIPVVQIDGNNDAVVAN